jgi:predicted nucleotidyltransferase
MDPDIVYDLVDRIAETALPLRVILFGSASRGEMVPGGGLDVLIIVPDGAHH